VQQDCRREIDDAGCDDIDRRGVLAVPHRTGQPAFKSRVVFDYDAGRELAAALAIGAKISPIAMV
jgi:hypothetical protein